MGIRLSEVMGLEIINIFNGDKYGYLGDSEMLFSKSSGEIISIEVNQGSPSIFSFKNTDTMEIPWQYKVKFNGKSGKTIIIDYSGVK